MALFQWITTAERPRLLGRLEHAVTQLGLTINQEFSTTSTIYARDPDGARTALDARVTVIISPNNGANDEFQVEVRSSEPMLKRGTRCEQIATELRAVIPAKA